LRSPRSEVILGEFPLGAPRGAPRICDERCCAHSVIVEDCRWGWQNNKNDSDNNNGNDDDSINNNSKQKQQQLRIHVRRIPLGGFSLLPFNPALGERPRVPRRGHPAVLSDSESLLAEASRKTLMRMDPELDPEERLSTGSPDVISSEGGTRPAHCVSKSKCKTKAKAKAKGQSKTRRRHRAGQDGKGQGRRGGDKGSKNALAVGKRGKVKCTAKKVNSGKGTGDKSTDAANGRRQVQRSSL
jgi:hypothetical protein